MRYKGNLHVHTTRSDGKKTPEDCIALYKQNGYDFLAITDHFRFFPDADKYCDETFTVLNGCELNFDSAPPNKSHHILCIEPENEVKFDRNMTPNEATKKIVESGGLSVLAHPYWSLMHFDDVLKLNNIVGLEIWNHISHAYASRGGSGVYADVCAASGKKLLLFATDDAHFYDTDFFGGYIMVESPSNSKRDLLEAIKAGRFYCSQGPQIFKVERQSGKIVAETSPVCAIAFLSDALWAKDRVQTGENGQEITGAVYEIKPNETYVRVECYDKDGKTAWSQLIYL